jgi:deoxyadenosine/deoxycytidine kinase
MSEFRYLIIDGLIKSGKTRLARILAEEFGARLILDNKENPFLNDYFMEVTRHENSLSLKTQLIFLLNRYSQQSAITQKGLFQKTTVSDYIFYRDAMYAHITLNDEELEIYKKIYNIFSENIAVADLVIYLQISFTEMLRRIHADGNEIIKSIPGDYWREVFEAFNYYFFNFKTSPLLVINMEKIDLDRKSDITNLINEIKNHKKGIRYYAPA